MRKNNYSYKIKIWGYGPLFMQELKHWVPIRVGGSNGSMHPYSSRAISYMSKSDFLPTYLPQPHEAMKETIYKKTM